MFSFLLQISNFVIKCLFIFNSRIFHFVTRDYFRYRDDSSDESDSDVEEIQRGDFVRGGIYAPASQSTVSITAARINFKKQDETNK